MKIIKPRLSLIIIILCHCFWLNGQIVKSEISEDFPTQFTKTKSDNSFSLDSILKERTLCNEFVCGFVLTGKELLSYDETGKKITHDYLVYDFENEAWKQNNKYYREYDNAGNICLYISYDWDSETKAWKGKTTIIQS